MSDAHTPVSALGAPTRDARVRPPTARSPAGAEDPARRVRRIVDESYAFLWRSLRRLGVPEAGVEDAAQQVLVVLARKLDVVQDGAERAFLFGVAVRVAADVRRSARRRPEDASVDVDAMPDHAPTPEDAAHASASRQVLDRALDELPIEQRTVLILFELEELTTAEVAEMLGIPHGTAASRLRLGRAAFKEAFARLSAEPGARSGDGGRT